MKKVLIALGIVFVLFIVTLVAVLIWAQRAGAALQEEFFNAVLSGDPKQVTARFHPALREEVDEPVLGAWMAAVKTNLGAFKGLSKTNFNTSTKYSDGAKVTESKGGVEFEKGQAEAELKYVNDQMTGFHVTSAKIPESWFKAPTDTQLYRERGKQFLTHFLGGQADEAFKMMHKSLQKKVPLEKVQAMMADFSGKMGKLKEMTYRSEEVDTSDGYVLQVNYKVECEKGPATGLVKFEYEGLKLHLLAFNVKQD